MCFSICHCTLLSIADAIKYFQTLVFPVPLTFGVYTHLQYEFCELTLDNLISCSEGPGKSKQCLLIVW